VVEVQSVVIPRKVHRDDPGRQPKACEYPISLRPSWFVTADPATQSAVTKALGFLPAIQLSTYAAVSTGVSPDGLWWLLDHIVDAVGGWYEVDEPPKAKAFVEVEIVDAEGFFGKGPVDPAYLAEYEQYLPRSKRYFVDARATGYRSIEY
jgi:hypothetical protein